MNIIIIVIVKCMRGANMNRKLFISLLSILVLSVTPVFADDTTATANTRPEPPRFENGTPPDFVKGQPPHGQPQHMNGEKGRFTGRRPSKKPDSKPGGDMTPPDWDSSSNKQDFQAGQPPKFDGNDSNGLPPRPPKENNSTISSES